MPLAEDRTEQYIRFHLSHFFRVDVLEILSHLPCLTAADQDKLRAYIERYGNRESVWKLFDHLRRRSGWVPCLIAALRECELAELADEVASVYAANQTPGFQSFPGATNAPASARNQASLPTTPPPSAGVPGPHPPASRSPSDESPPSLPDGTCNGYPEPKGEEALSIQTAPIQDTQPPASKSEVPPASLSPAHSGETSRNPQSFPGYSSFSAPASTGPGKHRKASGGSGDGPPASASVPPSSRGPVSPYVSFVPHSKKPGPTSGPQSAASRSKETQPVAAPGIHDTGQPAPRAPPGELRGPEEVPSPPRQVSPGPAPSRRALPPPEEEREISKPGALLSCADQAFSGGTENLLISSDSGSVGPLHLSAGSGNLPEENDYTSVTTVPSPGKQGGGSESPSLGTFELRVEEKPREALLGDSPDGGRAPGPAAQPRAGLHGGGSWGAWLGSAVAAGLFAVALAVLYKRIQK